MKRFLAIPLLVALAAAVGFALYQRQASEMRAVAYGPALPAAPRDTDFVFSMLDEPQALPAITFVDEDGYPVTLDDFHGRFVLLNIWATWCPPCREEMPALDRLQAKLGGADFEVVALSIDADGLPVIQDFYAQHGIKALKRYVDESGAVAYELGAIGIPTTLLIDRDGRELARVVGPREWDTSDVIGEFRQHLANSSRALARGQDTRE